MGAASIVRDLTNSTSIRLLGENISNSIQALSIVFIFVGLYYMMQYSRNILGNKPYFHLVNNPTETFRCYKAGAFGFCVLYAVNFVCRWFPQLSSITYSDIVMFSATLSVGTAYIALEGTRFRIPSIEG